ncbi:MerR family transcriptional regulator [Corynebacterium mendelii]|uniref:MerR family transcriptional regulator n=1 Tax=Corynebacterium mendelii TaxID=2765362 RepID=A0A939DZT7_9CORY|nr:MerR family transcriptional regulator [Corynebacterium mendelii]MBN9644290.1 MerR family transcriptional regulator [Corynebacterium mendelii]
MSQTDSNLYVGEVAEIFHLTVRTLHHWEKVGLISPSGRNWSNFRLYTRKDCERISRIVIYRATGMKLAEIKQILDSGQSAVEHLRQQRDRLCAKQHQVSEMIRAVDELLENEMNNTQLSAEEIGQILGDSTYAAYRAEAEQSYGSTTDWGIFTQRTSSWGGDDFLASKARCDRVDSRLAEAVAAGIAPDSERAAELVAEHAAVLSDFFPVTPAKHYLLSRAYVADERFRNYYDSRQEGLAQWLADAIAHHARAAGVDLSAACWQ